MKDFRKSQIKNFVKSPHLEFGVWWVNKKDLYISRVRVIFKR
jgi:hypothetical protein